MINFRYHVVSLTSVFLALAIGLVLGTAALNGPVLDNLNDQLSDLRKSNGQFRDRIDELEKAADSNGEFLNEVAVSTLSGLMTGKSVVIVQGPGADTKAREGVIAMLANGGATVTGNVALTNDFTDPDRDDSLHDLASHSVVPGVDLPESGEGVVTASALLGRVLLKGSDVSDSDRATVLQAFLEAGFITQEGRIEAAADGVVFLLGPAATDRDADARNKATVAIADQLADATPAAVASAPSAGDDGDPLVEIRDNDGLSNKLSTVDGVTTVTGQFVTAMAMVQQFAGGSGAYGTGEGADARAPIIR